MVEDKRQIRSDEEEEKTKGWETLSTFFYLFIYLNEFILPQLLLLFPNSTLHNETPANQMPIPTKSLVGHTCLIPSPPFIFIIFFPLQPHVSYYYYYFGDLKQI